MHAFPVTTHALPVVMRAFPVPTQAFLVLTQAFPVPTWAFLVPTGDLSGPNWGPLDLGTCRGPLGTSELRDLQRPTRDLGTSGPAEAHLGPAEAHSGPAETNFQYLQKNTWTDGQTNKQTWPDKNA